MKVLSVASARPNFVKLAAVHHAIIESGHEDISHVIVHTGQHYDPLLSDVFFEQLKIPQPAFNLGVHGGEREEVIEKTQDELEKVLPKINPDIVLVYGDVNGALGAAQAAKNVGIKLAHVEAGLRSFDSSMPEEHNRMGIDRIADLLFCSEESGVENLKKEGAKGEIHLIGNTMIDTLIRMTPIIESESVPVEIIKPFGVITLHRPSNVDDKKTLAAVLSFFDDVAHHIPLVLPVHHRLRHAMQEFGLIFPPHIRAIDALGYIPFLQLMKEAAFILTDSGGIQEEAVLIGKRCFTLRKNTERPSTIESGSNVLITDIEDPAQREKVLSFAKNPHDPKITIPEFWDGHAGERIVDILTYIKN